MNGVMNICCMSILYNVTVSNIVIILVQSSIANGVIFHVFLYLSEIMLASVATKNLSQPTFTL